MFWLSPHNLAQLVNFWNSAGHGPISNAFAVVGHGITHVIHTGGRWICDTTQVHYDNVDGIVKAAKQGTLCR